jgi:cytochrome c-type protein NapB
MYDKMNAPTDQRNVTGRLSMVLLIGVIGVAIVGFFVGINDGVPKAVSGAWADAGLATGTTLAGSEDAVHDAANGTVPAVSYSKMRRRQSGPTSQWKQSLDQIPQPKHDLFAEIKPSEADKLASTKTRASRRAFNGAPPVIPHLVENTTDAACYACHGKGMRIADRVANQMSHEFLANCTQCHATPSPSVFGNVDTAVASTFVGLPAPTKGERAYPGAPPTIPHSTWMRQTCLACHGNETGWAGLQSTHPWRINCTQCHGPSATLEQAVSGRNDFLPGPTVNGK